MLTHTKFLGVDTIISRCVQWKTADLGHTCLEEHLTEITKKILAVRPENLTRKKKRNKKLEWQLQAFYVKHKHKI